MTFQLRQALTGLETRVKERTADLEQARQQSEGRAQRLQGISDVARVISAEQNFEKLLALVAQLVSEKFGFYHTGIFLFDPAKKFAILRATNSEGGQRMLARGHRLEIGQTGIVGYVAQSGKPRIAHDVGADAVFFNNPELPATRSEMALPLTIRGEIIGVLDVQSTKPSAFNLDDINTLAIMADQIAIAIENARLFGQSEQALEEVRALYGQYLKQEWDAFTKQEHRVGYHQTLAGGRLIEEPVENEDIRKALLTGRPQIFPAGLDGGPPRITVPIVLRGQTIGILNIAAPEKDRNWTADELNLVQAVTERLALALENARLVQESLRRAAKEQKISQITTRIGASINMRNMLQVAVEELGRAIPGSEVVVQFHSNGDTLGQQRMNR
jgi:GAF domain-containing protein